MEPGADGHGRGWVPKRDGRPPLLTTIRALRRRPHAGTVIRLILSDVRS